MRKYLTRSYLQTFIFLCAYRKCTILNHALLICAAPQNGSIFDCIILPYFLSAAVRICKARIKKAGLMKQPRFYAFFVYSPLKGRRAILRARLIATVS